jgi:hypothetical protein
MSNVRPLQVTKSRVDVPTLCALSATAFVAACVSHEVLGHGLACVATGGAVKVLTSVYFECSAGLPIIDASGPSMNLAIALGAFIVLGQGAKSASARTFLALLVAFSGFWGAGYFLFSGVTNTGDWAFVLQDLSLEPRWLWRIVIVILGTWLYGLTLRLVAPVLPRGPALLAAYLSAGVVACASTLFYSGATGPAMLEAAQESLVASLGLLYLAFARPRSPSSLVPVLARNKRLQSLGLVVVGVFWLTQGRGYQAPNHSIERTSSSQLRWLAAAAHVER